MDTISAIIEWMDRAYRLAPEILVLATIQCALAPVAMGGLLWGVVIHRRIARAITELKAVREEADTAVAHWKAWYDRAVAVQADIHAEAARLGMIKPPVVH